MSITKRRYPFYLSITALAVSLVIMLSAIFLWISHKESTKAALGTADQLFAEINQKMLDRYEHALSAVAGWTGAVARMPGMVAPHAGDLVSYPGFDVMIEAMRYYDYLFSVYAGYADGTFYQIINPRDNQQVLGHYQAPADTRYIIRAIVRNDQGERRQQWHFLNADKQVVDRREEAAPAFDPRIRPWYRQAVASDRAGFTRPYLFSHTGLPGITCAEQLPGGIGVIGADITLERFTRSLQQQKVSENSVLFLFDADGRLLAHSQKGVVHARIEKRDTGEGTLDFPMAREVDDPVVRALAARSGSGEVRYEQTRLQTIGKVSYLVRLSSVNPTLGFPMKIGSVAPLDDFTGHLRRMQYQTSVSSLVVLALLMPIVLVGGRRFSHSLIRLGAEADKVRRFDFSSSPPFDSIIKEIHSLIKAFELMRITIQQRTSALIATQKKLETLVQSGIALSAEQDVNRLMETIFTSAGALSNTDGGALYLRDKNDQLNLAFMQTASRQTIRPDEMATAEKIKPVPLFDPESGAENHATLESHVALTGKPMVINSAEDKGFDLAATCFLDDAAGRTCDASLTVPLKPREEASIGVLQLFNARDAESGALLPFDDEIVGFVEALAAQAAIAMHNKNLLEAQRELFNAFIQLIAGAIDAKSPYTGGHCARVPEIAVMLAEAAHASQASPLMEFRMDSPEEWQEFKVAAWLHDCGKVTTPEYVVDKATKLETIYNRIHEVRTRFEVLWRDAEILYYKDLLEAKRPKEALAETLQQTQARLREEFAFVAQCNVGGEFMADEAIERLQTIAGRKWLRHFDDRIGLSQDEQERKSRTAEQELPAEESLLADKSDHIISRGGVDPFDGNPHGFKMDAPEALYNQGELYNLSIRKGTLTDEERFKINEHIIQTYLMLKRLPFPKSMQAVPDVAASHHETMNGTGYPRKLNRDDMSIPARIMAVADIFEALTATDRPYKKGKTLSEALRIMSFMRNDQHIDADLFDLFLKSGVYHKYAEQFLRPDQIDEVDIRNYLAG